MSIKDTIFPIKQTINCGGTIVDLTEPCVMGILNVTPDSFFDGGRYDTESKLISRVSAMLEEGAAIIDIGAYSSRPGAADVSAEEEKLRLKPALAALRRHFPESVLSVDTYRAEIADYVVKEFGVGMINDISSGLFDEDMLTVTGKLKVPYIMMHMKGTPETMQDNPTYTDVTKEILSFFAQRITIAKECGIEDIILDVGFGFGKTLQDNYTLLNELKLFEVLGVPIMVGLSRKSMIYKPLHITPDDALNGTTVLHTLALTNGARILRAHDVREAMQVIRLTSIYAHTARLSDNLPYI